MTNVRERDCPLCATGFPATRPKQLFHLADGSGYLAVSATTAKQIRKFAQEQLDELCDLLHTFNQGNHSDAVTKPLLAMGWVEASPHKGEGLRLSELGLYHLN